MGYNQDDGTYSGTYDLVLFAKQTVSTDVSSGSYTVTGAISEISRYGSARVTLNVTAHSGTNPTLDVTVQGSPDKSTWATLATFTQVTTTATVTARKLMVADRYIRGVAAVGGTGSPTYELALTGDAV